MMNQTDIVSRQQSSNSPKVPRRRRTDEGKMSLSNHAETAAYNSSAPKIRDSVEKDKRKSNYITDDNMFLIDEYLKMQHASSHNF